MYSRTVALHGSRPNGKPHKAAVPPTTVRLRRDLDEWVRRYAEARGITQTQVLNLAVERLRSAVDEDLVTIVTAIEGVHGR